MGLTMALRMIIGALKRAYPRVPVMTTDELQHLMKKTASQSGYRKLVLLVSKRCSTSLVFSAVCILCIPQTSVRSFQRVQETLALVIGLRCPCGCSFQSRTKAKYVQEKFKIRPRFIRFCTKQQPTTTNVNSNYKFCDNKHCLQQAKPCIVHIQA